MGYFFWYAKVILLINYIVKYKRIKQEYYTSNGTAQMHENILEVKNITSIRTMQLNLKLKKLYHG